MSVPCVLVTPKRKLAGKLAVMKNFLHFFGEFLVEGTGGLSVFKNFDVSTNSDVTRLEERPRSVKWPMHVDLGLLKGVSIDNVETLNDNAQQKQSKQVKRHRRWNIGKVNNF